MPEGHTVHRLAAAFTAGFGGQRVRLASPQGRFATEAAGLDGHVLLGGEAVGKHLLLALAPEVDVAPEDPAVRFVHVHLGLYGSWTFAGEDGFAVAHAIGAPRRRVAEAETDVDGAAGEAADWRRIVPRQTVRLRVIGEHGLADLTGPAACELYDAEQRAALLARLGPDPLRADADPGTFIARVRRSRTGIGVLLMNQDVIAGVGNIYRAEGLFRARLDPFVPGRDLTGGMLAGIWEDLAALMRHGARTGRIVTTQPEHRDVRAGVLERSRGRGAADGSAVPREKSFYVYHRQTLPCRLCATTIRTEQLAGRAVYWCPRCQTIRSRRAAWSREHPATWVDAVAGGAAA